MKRYKRFGLLGKMVFYYSVFLVALIFVLINIAYRYMLNVSIKNAEISQQQLSDKLLTQVEARLSEMDRMARQICADTKIISIFQDLQQDPDRKNYFETDMLAAIDSASLLTSHNGPDAAIWRISVYNQYGDFIHTGAGVQPGALTDPDRYPFPVPIEEMMDSLLRGPNENLITQMENDHWSGLYGDSRFISVIRPLTDYYGREVYGIVQVQQDAKKLESIIGLEILSDVTAFIFDREGNQVLPRDVGYHELADEQSFVTRLVSEEFGWSVALVQNRQQMTKPYRHMILYLYLGGIAVVICLVLAVYAISRHFSRPIVELSGKVLAVSIDTIPSDLSDEKNSDELQELSAAFTFMFQRLKNSLEAEKRAYLLALQSQMDPHFLYNTLTVISGMVIEENYDSAVNACNMLSDMLRYSSSYDTHSTVLQDEMENIRNYLQLMKLRFEHFFSYSIEMEDRLRDMPMPRLVLQPFVENCFEHGFKKVKPPWEVQVRARWAEGGWEINITDNGTGISDEDIARLEKKIREYSGNLSDSYREMKIGGMGLANTITRLKLLTNGHVEYKLERNTPTGTIVTLTGRDSRDPDSDR